MRDVQKTPSDTIHDIVTMSALGAVLFVGQLGMSFLPNIEPVSALIIPYTLVYKRKVFPAIYVFVLLEGLSFGFGIWWISYLYIWSILALAVLLFRKMDSPILWAVLSGAFGLSFGALCAIPYLISGGPYAAFSYWSAGIPYDIAHCAGNFVLTLVLYKPILQLLNRQRHIFNPSSSSIQPGGHKQLRQVNPLRAKIHIGQRPVREAGCDRAHQERPEQHEQPVK